MKYLHNENKKSELDNKVGKTNGAKPAWQSAPAAISTLPENIRICFCCGNVQNNIYSVSHFAPCKTDKNTEKGTYAHRWCFFPSRADGTKRPVYFFRREDESYAHTFKRGRNTILTKSVLLASKRIRIFRNFACTYRKQRIMDLFQTTLSGRQTHVQYPNCILTLNTI